jgi:hypothetical protein
MTTASSRMGAQTPNRAIDRISASELRSSASAGHRECYASATAIHPED